MQNKVKKNAEGQAVTDVNNQEVYEMEVVCPKGDDIKDYVETNWLQLTKEDAYLKKCPDNWEVPADPLPADVGSFKGYTNRYTFSPVNDDAHDEGNTVTFNNESEPYMEWTNVAKVGAIGGFGVFGLGIIIVIINIAIDMRRRMAMYDELI